MRVLVTAIPGLFEFISTWLFNCSADNLEAGGGILYPDYSKDEGAMASGHP